MSPRVASGLILESLLTKPALYPLTLATIAASSSIVCDPYINETPPDFASAIASLSPDTDCIIAETIGMVISIAGFSPSLNLTNGVLRLTLSGMHSLDEYPGISKYSLNVCDGSLI